MVVSEVCSVRLDLMLDLMLDLIKVTSSNEDTPKWNIVRYTRLNLVKQ